MIIFGFVKETKYSGDGTLIIKTRIPNIHGPYKITDAKGKKVVNYVEDKDLPWYPSLVLPYLPKDGDVVAISSLDETSSSFMILGLTGGSYTAGTTPV